MRWLLGLFVLIGVLLVVGLFWAKGLPYRKYSAWVNGQGQDHLFQISNFKPFYLVPTGINEVTSYKEDYTQLWREFPIRNSVMPLPTRHPLFSTIPIVDVVGKNMAPHMGMSILSSQGRELSRIYTLPTQLFPDHTLGQELFRLPYVKNRILKQNLDDVWKDIFSYRVEPKEKSLDEMIYDLYIIHIRSRFLPKEAIRYGLIKEGKQALIELASQNKDYTVEMVLTLSGGTIYSYVLKTEKINADSTKLRSKFLSTVTFSPIDTSMGKILYTEFKQLNFARQVDQEGMIYLFSAWTQDPDNVDLLKEMIFYLERGQNNQGQLKNLYQYAFQRYGKTFSNRAGEELADPELNLQRNIEIEQAQKRLEAEKARLQPAPEPELTPDEKMNLYLKKAKEEKLKKKDMTIH